MTHRNILDVAANIVSSLAKRDNTHPLPKTLFMDIPCNGILHADALILALTYAETAHLSRAYLYTPEALVLEARNKNAIYDEEQGLLRYPFNIQAALSIPGRTAENMSAQLMQPLLDLKKRIGITPQNDEHTVLQNQIVARSADEQLYYASPLIMALQCYHVSDIPNVADIDFEKVLDKPPLHTPLYTDRLATKKRTERKPPRQRQPSEEADSNKKHREAELEKRWEEAAERTRREAEERRQKKTDSIEDVAQPYNLAQVHKDTFVKLHLYAKKQRKHPSFAHRTGFLEDGAVAFAAALNSKEELQKQLGDALLHPLVLREAASLMRPSEAIEKPTSNTGEQIELERHQEKAHRLLQQPAVQEVLAAMNLPILPILLAAATGSGLNRQATHKYLTSLAADDFSHYDVQEVTKETADPQLATQTLLQELNALGRKASAKTR